MTKFFLSDWLKKDPTLSGFVIGGIQKMLSDLPNPDCVAVAIVANRPALSILTPAQKAVALRWAYDKQKIGLEQ